LALNGGERPDPHSGRLTPEERAPGAAAAADDNDDDDDNNNNNNNNKVKGSYSCPCDLLITTP